jgi:outer membrane protein TolC
VAQLEARSLADPALRAFVETNLHHAFPEWPMRTWDFEMLTLAALYLHPSLDVARAEWHLAEAGVQTAGGRPNPVLSVATLDLPIETAGKRGHRIAQARQLSKAARLNLASVAWQVRSNLHSSLLDYSAARQRAGLLQKQVQVQQQIIGLLEQRLQAGAIARNELTPQRIALVKAETDLADATRQAAEARVRIAEALGVGVQAIEGVEFTLPLGTDTTPELTSTEARQQALLGRSDILVALAEYAAAESALQLEIAKQYPDIHLSPSYQFDQGEHKWSLGISVELPVLNQNQGPIAEAEAKREGAAARFVALQARIISEIDSALAAHATAREQMAQQGRLTQLAREQSTVAEAMFQAGAADKLDLASAQLEASVSDLASLDAEIKARQAVVQIEDAIQRPLEAWPPLEQSHMQPGRQEKP